MFQLQKRSAALTMYLHKIQEVQQQRNLRTTLDEMNVFLY